MTPVTVTTIDECERGFGGEREAIKLWLEKVKWVRRECDAG